jgi:hypothetical protein
MEQAAQGNGQDRWPRPKMKRRNTMPHAKKAAAKPAAHKPEHKEPEKPKRAKEENGTPVAGKPGHELAQGKEGYFPKEK